MLESSHNGLWMATQNHYDERHQLKSGWGSNSKVGGHHSGCRLLLSHGTPQAPALHRRLHGGRSRGADVCLGGNSRCLRCARPSRRRTPPNRGGSRSSLRTQSKFRSRHVFVRESRSRRSAPVCGSVFHNSGRYPSRACEHSPPIGLLFHHNKEGGYLSGFSRTPGPSNISLSRHPC